MQKLIFSLSFIIILYNSVDAQRGVQVGIGLGTMLMTYNAERPQSVISLSSELNNFKIKGHNAYFFEFKLDYAFNHIWQLKSCVQYRFRNISFIENVSLDRNTDLISIPFMLNYRIPVSFSRKLSLGLSAGLSIDRYFNNKVPTEFRGSSANIVESTTIHDKFLNGSILSFNGSWRFGLDLEKNLAHRGRLSIQLLYSYTHLGNIVDSYSNAKQTIYNESDPTVILSEKSEILVYDGRQSGYLLGVNYYFGALNWNKN